MKDNEKRDDEQQEKPDWIPIPPEGFEDIGQGLLRSYVRFRPLPPFVTGEDRSFSWEITSYIEEDTTAVLTLLQAKNLEDLARMDLRENLPAISVKGEPIEKSDPRIRDYSPPDITAQVRLVPGPRRPLIGPALQQRQAIKNGARYYLEGTAPELLYSSRYTFALFLAGSPTFGIGGRHLVTDSATVVLDVVGTPVWESIPTRVFNEGQSISIDVKDYVKNEVDNWIVSAMATAPSGTLNAPTFPLSINNGIILSVATVPQALTQSITYTYTVTSQNAVDPDKVQRENIQTSDKMGQFKIVPDPPQYRGTLDVDIDEGQGREEGAVVIGNIKRYLVDALDPADRYQIRVYGQTPPDAPDITLRINPNGDILIVGGAPLIDSDVTYWVQVTGLNDGGQGEFIFNIAVRAEAPVWGVLDNQSSVSDARIRIPIGPMRITNYDKSHSLTDPIRYRVKVAPGTLLRLTANPIATGGVELQGMAPNVASSTEFTVTVGATNNASRNVWSEASYIHTITPKPRPQGEPSGALPTRFVAGSIPPQYVLEGELINIDISVFVQGNPTGYMLDEIRRSPNLLMPDPPNPELDLFGTTKLVISRLGIITGIGQLVNAPNVTADDRYTLTVRILGDPITTTDATRAFTLVIQQKEPLWGNIPNHVEDEGNELNYDVSSYVNHDPDSYAISEVTPSRADSENPPPPISLGISNDGVIAHSQLPQVEQNEEYTVGVTGRNNAGADTGYFVLRVNDTIPRWLTIPEQSGIEEEEDFLINLSVFTENNPQTYSVISVTKGRADAPDLSLAADSITGLIRKTLPKVSQTETYTVVVRCSNAAGNATPDASFTLKITNKLPVWLSIPQYDINEGVTRSLSLAAYVEDRDGVTFTSGTPVLTNTNAFTGTRPTLIAATTSDGVMTITAPSVDGADAYFNVPIVARNDAGSRSATLIVRVIDTTGVMFDSCEDQEIREGRSLDFTIHATSEFTVTYSLVSGPSWAAPNSGTGHVGGTAPPVSADTDFTVVYRASATNTQGTADTADDITVTADCTITITVLNYVAPPPGTGPSWDTIPDRYYGERTRFSFNIASYVSGNPTPTLGERTGAGTPEFVRVSSGGQVSGDGPSVGTVSTQATNDGKIWKITLSAGRTLSASQVSFVSGVLASDNRLVDVVAGTSNTIHYLVFSGTVSSMLRSAIRIAGSPSASVRNLEKSWYNTFTVYVTAINTVSSTLRSAHANFQMFFINTDDTLVTALQAPTLNVPNQNIDEGDSLSLDLTEYTTGTNTAENPITYERSLRTETSRFSLPDWENLGTGGSGVFLSSAGMLTGVAPEINGDVENTVYVTARNSVGVGGDRFTITILDDAVIGHREPVWEIGNKRYVATQDTADIDPIRDGEVEGTPPITITLTDATANPLPSWLTLSNNVLSGSPALSDVGVSTIALTATNTNTRGTSYSSAVTFTVTVVAPPGPTDPHVAPVWNISPLSVDEGEIVKIDPLTDDQLTGTPPITITVTDATATPLPSWLPLSNNILRGTAVAAGSPFTVALTATNTDASNVDYTATTSFTITVTPSTQPHSPPSWSIDNLSYEEDVQVTIAPIVDETLTGSSPLTISLTDGMTMPLPPWLSLSGNVLRGRTPTGLTTDQISTIALRGSNTDTTGTVHTSDTTFTITVTAGEPPDDPDCVPPLVRGIRRQIVYTGETTTLDITGYIREGNPVPNVRDDPDYHTLPFVTSPNHGRGFIRITVPGRRSDYTPLLGRHEQFIIIENECGSVKRSFFITVEQARFIPPVIGDLPNVTLEAGDTYSDDLNDYITSTHASEFPRWRKQQVDPAADESGWQNADWWTVGEHGGLSITGQPVNRDTTNTLSVEAYNPDGLDTGHFELTFPYVPRPPYCEMIPDEEANEGERISFRLDQYITNTFTTIRIDSVVKINSASPELFLKSVNSPAHLVGTIEGSNNASNSGAVGTKALAAVGSAPDVDTVDVPSNLTADHDYTVTITVINTGLVTTPKYPNNSSQCTFTFRMVDVQRPIVPPTWVEIPLQTSVSGESISMSLSQYARNSPSDYSIVSTTHARGANPGTIILQASRTGVVTRQGGAVAPPVTTEAVYNVVIRATNAGGSSDCPFVWRIVPVTVIIADAPALIFTKAFSTTGRGAIGEYDPATGMSVLYTFSPGVASSAVPVTGTDNSEYFIEGVGSTIYALKTDGVFGTIAYTGIYFRGTAAFNSTGSITATGVTLWRGLTSIGSVLYSFGYSISDRWKLYSIDPSTRVATAVNTASTANNLGLPFNTTGFFAGGLASSGTTIYAVIRPRLSRGQLISIPTTGTQRGIATTIGSEFITNTPRGVENFNGTIQGIIQPQGIVSSVVNFNTTTGAQTRVRDNYSSFQMTSITQYALTKPTIGRIPIQRVQEGQPINFPIAAYVTGAQGYRLGFRGLEAVTTGAPIFPLEISASGIISGTTGNENAPLVNTNSYYSLDVIAYNSAGGTTQTITVAVLNSPPIWVAVPQQFINEGDAIEVDILPYVLNQPTHFTLGAITKPRPEAPNLDLQISRRGIITGVGATVNAPEVDMDERYSIVVTAENAAGARSTTIALTIVDLGNLADQVPFVRRWDVPEDPQPGPFDILVDFNIPVYGLSPRSFVFEGVELRGNPLLLWSPIPGLDVPSNRPTAEQRNLDYLTNPVPVRGTKYFKLSFPSSVLPDVLDRDKLLNIYVTANAARGGQS